MHPRLGWWLAIPAMAGAGPASAEQGFTELNGVPEDLAVRVLASVDFDGSWSWLGWIAAVVAVVAADHWYRRKHKD